MIVGTIVKQLAERFPVSIDFNRRLQSGESLTSATVTAVLKATGADASATVLEGATGFAAGIVTRMTKATAGNDGVDYVLAFQAVTTPGGHILEDELLLQVRETATA